MTRWWSSPRFLIYAAAVVTAISLTLRIALAAIFLDERTIPATLRAASLTPADEAVYLQLANLDAERREMYLMTAADLNPRDPKPLLDLGLMAEFSNDRDQAEGDFRRAAQLDVRVEPSWMLANFYFQQGNQAQFHFWANRYREFSAGDAIGLFRMEWSRTHSVPQLLKSFRPLTCGELASMAEFLDMRAMPVDALPVDRELVSCPGSEATTEVLRDVSRLLTADRPGEALKLWNALGQNRSFPYTPLDPPTGAILTNSDFSYQMDELGFNWRVNRTPGVKVRRLSRSLELNFDGREPEVSTVLFEPVVLDEGTTYRLSFQLHSGDADSAGFGWRLVELSTGKTIDSETGDQADRHENAISWTFAAPHSTKTTVLAFTYVRPAGHPKEQGNVVLSDIKLVVIPKEVVSESKIAAADGSGKARTM
jgi:hypothetical protein